MRRARIGLFTLAFAAAPLLARGAPAPEPDASTAPASACAVPAPRPLLKTAEYSGHTFLSDSDNTAVEKASTGTIHIEIRFSGCRDGFEHDFIFVEDEPRASYGDRDHWLRFATEQMKALQTFRRGREDVKDLLDFLSGAKIATTRRTASELRLEVCRDGSPNAGGACPPKSGGGWRFAVRALENGRIQVEVGRYLGARG
jgi:hypothetical protein